MLLYLGRLKRYKRIELLLDVLEADPGGHARDGRRGRPPRGDRARHRPTRACTARAHARPRERGEEARAAPARLGEHDGVVGRGLVPDRDGGGGVRDAQRGDGRGRAARVDRRRRDRTARRSTPEELVEKTRLLVQDTELRERLGARARERAREFTWDRTAERNLNLLEEERERQLDRPSPARSLGAHRHRARGRARRLGDRGQRDRARRSRSSSPACSARATTARWPRCCPPSSS